MPYASKNTLRDVPVENGLTWLAWSGETFVGYFATKPAALAAVEMGTV